MDLKDIKLEKVNRGNLLNQKIYKVLKCQILEGGLEPGTRLSELKLAEQMGVSRTPIREAIKFLAVEGFVKISPGHGTVVTGISIKDLEEVLQVRGALDALMAKLAIEKITVKEINRLEKMVEEMERHCKEKNLTAFSSCSQKFQDLIMRVSGNRHLARVRRNICDQTFRYRIISLSSPKRLPYSLKEHRDIFEAIKNKKSEMAEKMSYLHTENVFKNIMQHIKKNGNEDEELLLQGK